MLKKLLPLLMGFMLLLSPCFFAHADDISDYIWEEYTDTWSIADVYDNGRTSLGDSWRLFYVSYPATETGESDSLSFHADDELKQSGILSVSAEQIEEALNLSLNAFIPSAATMRFSYQKGEYVRIYLRNDYQKYTLLQCGERTGTARPAGEPESSAESPVHLTGIPCGSRPYEILIPLLPQIKIEHYNHLEDPLYEQGIRTEIYTCIGVDGGYACTASYVRPYEVISDDEESEF